jgi:hypothetical protein
MNVRLHIERLVVDEGLLSRGERAGIAQAIERELHLRLAGPHAAYETVQRRTAPAHVQAIGAGIVERIPLADGERRPSPSGVRA